MQRRLDELRAKLGDKAIAALATRLNQPNGRLATMWEVAVLHALAQMGELENEVALESGKRPDIIFHNHEISFLADIRTISDEGIDKNNPVRQLETEIKTLMRKLGLPAGGLNIRVGAKWETTARGKEISLRLPERSRIRELVQEQIKPSLKQQIAQGLEVLHFEVKDEHASVQGTIDTRGSRSNQVSYAAYNIPTIPDRNPLYSALEDKAKQLKGAGGLVGVIICDGDTRTLAERKQLWDDVSVQQIVEKFFQQHSLIGFVLLLSVREESRSNLDWVRGYKLHGTLIENKSRTGLLPVRWTPR